MKKNNSTSQGSAHSKAIVAAAVIGLPLVGLPAVAGAQIDTKIATTSISTIRPLETQLVVKFSEKTLTTATIMGMDSGRPVYKNSRGGIFLSGARHGRFSLPD